MLNVIAQFFRAEDKRKHLKVGGLVLVWALTLLAVAVLFRLHLGTMLLAGVGLTSALTEEGSQWLANRDRRRQGLAPLRDVSAADALAGSLACLLAAVALEWAVRHEPAVRQLLG